MALDMLLEIGSEEIPAGYIRPALETLRDTAEEALRELRLAHRGIQVWGTPRRLAILVEHMDAVQAASHQEVIGPPIQIAFAEDGEPTPAAKGFARAHGVPVDDLEVIETSRGSYVAVRKQEELRPASEILPSSIPKWIRRIPFPKSMRWKDLDLRFARPIHWIVALLGDQVLRFDLETLSSGRATRGHRFMNPQQADIPYPGAYLDLCRSLHVFVDPVERREMIHQEAQEAARDLSGRLVEDPSLLETIVYLVEYPVAITGRFEPEYLKLPREILVTVMREHQKFFSVEDKNGHLLPYFINIANIRPGSLDLIREGNERVLKARLSDARFFFEEDRKRPLEEYVGDLQGVIFHAKLGTLLDKVHRVQVLASAFAEELEPEVVGKVERAAWLCKADLTTEMVSEFPSLQGVMGQEYALKDGEDPEVALALCEYYLPAFAGDRVPSTPVGALLGLADKFDTILGCFGVGEIPTGAGDPFGVRRAALGIIHILQHQDYEIPLSKMIHQAHDLIAEKVGLPGEIGADVLSFFRVRLQNLWTSQGRPVEAVEAVLSSGFENIPDAFRRLQALEAFMEEDGFVDLAVSFKRVLNIVGESPIGVVDPALFEHAQEKELFDTLVEAEGRVAAFLGAGRPLQALEALAATRNRIDRFFDAVLVNVEDIKLRENRLSMLARLGRLFLQLADFSKISTRP